MFLSSCLLLVYNLLDTNNQITRTRGARSANDVRGMLLLWLLRVDYESTYDIYDIRYSLEGAYSNTLARKH